MFELQHPLWLLAWLVLPVVALRPRWSGGRARLLWSALPKGASGRTWRVRLAWLPEALGILGLALLIFALARPQLTRREAVVQSEGIDIMLAIDTSGSMDAMDFEVNGREMNRLEVAKLVVGEFIRQRAYDRVGLVVFGEEAFTQAPLTLDHEGLLRFLSNVEIGIAGRSATAVGEAIAVSAARLSRLEAPTKVAIVLTDGRSNAGQVGPIEAAKAAAALGVRVYTIGVGAHSGGNQGGLFGFFRGGGRDEIDEDTLTAVAEATGAQYFRATDTRSLLQIYETIDTLERTTAEVEEHIHRDELFHRALLPGLALILAQLILASTVFRRIP